jgi:CRP-like cAMP-binding protein
MLATRLNPSSNDQHVDSERPTCPTAIASLTLKFKSVGIETDALDALVRFLRRRPSILAGDDIIENARSAGYSTLLLAGVACMYKRLDGGSRQIYSFQYPGDFCDLFRYVLPERDEDMAVQALTECSVAIIDYADLEPLLAQHAQLGLALWRTTILESSILRERLSSARRGSALQSVASLICEQLARREAIGLAGSVVPITQIDVADAAALSIVHVNRTIQTLRRLNVLCRTNHAIEVADKEQLARIAGFDGRYLNMPQLVSGWRMRGSSSSRISE